MPKKDHCALQADHEDAVHTYCHFLLAINTDLICNKSESMIKHKQDKKSIACTRILSSHGVTWGATKACYWECQVDHDAVNTYSHFLSAINIDLNYSAFGSRNTCETNKKRIFFTSFSSLLGGAQKLTTGKAVMGRPHDALVRNSHFLSAFYIGLICIYTGVRSHINETKKHHLGHKNSPLEWPQLAGSKPTMMLSSQTAILF
jgi:hypothetical protein